MKQWVVDEIRRKFSTLTDVEINERRHEFVDLIRDILHDRPKATENGATITNWSSDSEEVKIILDRLQIELDKSAEP